MRWHHFHVLLKRRLRGTAPLAEPTWQWGLRPVALGKVPGWSRWVCGVANKAYLETLSNGYDVPWLCPATTGAGWWSGLLTARRVCTKVSHWRDDLRVREMSNWRCGSCRQEPCRAEADAYGQGLRVPDTDGRSLLKYAGLHVFDAVGREPPGTPEVVRDRMRTWSLSDVRTIYSGYRLTL